MKRAHRPMKDNRHEGELFRRRAVAAFALALLGILGLGARFYWLQVLRHDDYSARADSNRISMRHIAPSRGLIYDRNGVLLAENVAAFRLEVVPERVADMPAMLDELGQVVALDQEDIQRFNTLRKSRRSYMSVPLRMKLAEEEIARFSVERWRFPGVDVVPYLTRSYPLGKDFGHVIGYVGRLDTDDLARVDTARYDGTTHIGKTGIERYYEDLLHGEPGYDLVEVNANRRPLRTLERTPPTPGKNLYLSIDAHLQRAAEEAFGGATGALVAIDPRNGEVLALVSVPGFDPNLFVNGISRTDYQLLLNAPDRPLFNRALIGTFEPGSTIKPFMALAGLELGIRKRSDTVFSSGEFYIPGQPRAYRDWRHGGHGRVDVVEALAQSVNTYFYSLALDLGIDRMSQYLGQFGFGAPTGIDLAGEGRGILPSREWKRGAQSQPWFPGETVIAGIGQGYWTTTPIQLAHATATLAARGVARRPHLLRAVQDGFNAPIVEVEQPPAAASLIRDPANWALVEQGMVAVVNGPTGTARRIGEDAPYVIAGKTGTAQRFSRTESNEQALSALDARQKYKALFIAYAPVEEPRIALGLVLEFAASGSGDAAPMARRVLDAWFAAAAAPAQPGGAAAP